MFEVQPTLWVGLPGLSTDTQTVQEKLKFRTQVRIARKDFYFIFFWVLLPILVALSFAENIYLPFWFKSKQVNVKKLHFC